MFKIPTTTQPPPFVRPSLDLPHFSSLFVVSNTIPIQPTMKLAIASLIVGSAAAFQPHTALSAVPKSSSALDMKVRFRSHSNSANEEQPIRLLNYRRAAGGSTEQEYDMVEEARRLSIRDIFLWRRPSWHNLCRLLATLCSRTSNVFLPRKIQVGPSAFRQIEVGIRL